MKRKQRGERNLGCKSTASPNSSSEGSKPSCKHHSNPTTRVKKARRRKTETLESKKERKKHQFLDFFFLGVEKESFFFSLNGDMQVERERRIYRWAFGRRGRGGVIISCGRRGDGGRREKAQFPPRKRHYPIPQLAMVVPQLRNRRTERR